MSRKYYQEGRWHRHFEWARDRCNRKENDSYRFYGKRGIKFYLTRDQVRLLWIRDNASKMKKPSLDRIEPDGPYCVENCRFIEFSENSSGARPKLLNTLDRKRYGRVQHEANSV